MRISLISLLSLFIIPLTLGADLASLEVLTGEWMALRKERAHETEAWKLEENRLRMELRLLEDAEVHLQEELEALRQEETETETAQADLIHELEVRQSLRDALQPGVGEALRALVEDTGNLPPPLLRRLEDERAAADAAGRDLLPRTRALLGLHNQWLLLQTALHTDSMVLELGGGRREMEVLWIGTALAYAVNADGSLAAVGRPGHQGWVWSENHTVAPRVRQALRIQRQDAPPSLIRLPAGGLE